MRLPRLFPALTTPFENARFAADRLADNLARYERCGIRGFLVLGSTGEAPYLEPDERAEIVRTARRALPTGCVLMAGVGQESTAATIRLAREAADAGADVVLVLTPFYFRESMTAEALERHFTAVADACPVPILLYHVPKFTGLRMPAEVAVRLSSHPNVAGLKDSSGDPAWMREVLAGVPPSFQVLCGSAAQFACALDLGAAGGVLAAADVFPEPLLRVAALAAEGDRAGAAELNREIAGPCAAIVGAGIPAIKAALDLRGLYGGPPRPPLLGLDSGARDTIREAIDDVVERGLAPRTL